MKVKLKQWLSICLALFMTASFSFVAFASNVGKGSNNSAYASTRVENVSFENVTGNVDLTSVVIENFSQQVKDATELSKTVTKVKDEVRTVIITIDAPSLVDYAGEREIPEYLTTDEGRNATLSIKKSQDETLSALNEMGIKYTVESRYDAVINAVAINVNTKELSALKSVPTILSAVVSETYAVPETVTGGEDNAQTNPSNVYKTGIYDTTNYDVNYAQTYGLGMTVAVLDTGLDYTHEAFSDKYTDEEIEVIEREGMTQSDVNDVLSALSATQRSKAKGEILTADDLHISNKVPFAYDYADDDADVYPSYSQHGVHVAGIVAGEASYFTDKDGNVFNEPFLGSAPNAQLVICKVFTDDLEDDDIGGATSDDIIAALNDCVKLGVDVINMSLGTSAGFSSLYLDGDSEGNMLYEVYESIKERGISLMCAASNDFSSGYGGAYGTNLKENPDSATIGSPSTFNGAMSIASINGQKAPYMTVNGNAVFFEESSDANSVQYDFIGSMLGNEDKKTFKYVVVPGVGQAVDYSNAIVSRLNDKQEGEKVIAVVKRGITNFQEKVEIAQRYGADAIIIYNNVAGLVRMNLGDLIDPIPAISVSIDAGKILTDNAVKTVGYITVDKSLEAGPFMNDYSSWGPTPQLELKPDVTAHGGEIISAVAGGYTEMSGTSMATPNIAGLTALVRSYVEEKFPEYNAVEVNRLTNQLLMSTATTVYDQQRLPYSPRKQGSGLATVANIFTTGAYLSSTQNGEDSRPKIELGADEEQNGEYELTFSVTNFTSDKTLSFTTETLFFTETVALGNMAVAEKAYPLNGSPVWYTVNGEQETELGETAIIEVPAGETVDLKVTITMSTAEKNYIKNNFKNGMYVEGFLKLISQSEGQCDLTIPYLGFFGDWESATMLDYDCFEIAESEKDTSLNEDEKLKPSVWATQAYSMYYNAEYVLPMGSFVYAQDEHADQVYVNQDYAALSCVNIDDPNGDAGDYMTATGFKALYAGLLRNAELVTYTVTNQETGEIVATERVYRVNKAYSGGGRGIPAQVLMEKTPADFGLTSNGKYEIKFNFYREYNEQYEEIDEENTFTMTFYVDYDAPVLEKSTIRFYDYEENDRMKQRVYLDLDIYDNHYPQAVLLCYGDTDSDGQFVLKLATEYIVPVYDPIKNATNRVSIEITEFYEKYKDRLYVQIDDYALNHNVYTLNFDNSKTVDLPDEFEIVTGTDGEITIGLNECVKIELAYEGNQNPSSFEYTSSNFVAVKVKNGEIFGARVGRSTITVDNKKGKANSKKKLIVNVVDTGKTLTYPTISFGVIENNLDSIVPARGSVDVNAGQTFRLEIKTDPWYYDIEDYDVLWKSTDETVATVTQDGVVTTQEKRGTSVITAVIVIKDEQGNVIRETPYATTVVLNVQEPFTISNMTLTEYHGFGGHVVIPDDENIMYIGEEAFEDNLLITSVVIPKTVQYIHENAFEGCVNLKEIYFVSVDKLPVPESDLSLIYRTAFSGCTSLEKLDLSNVKVVTLDKVAFQGCTNLKTIVDMHKIVKMDDGAFYGCTSLETADVTGVHTSGAYVFQGCTSLKEVITAQYTVLGRGMFFGCSNLEEVTLHTPYVPDEAFARCGLLKKITFADGLSDPIVIGANAFEGCISLTTIDFGDNVVKSIGSSAFKGCEKLSSIDLSDYPEMGSNVFDGTLVSPANEAIYNGTILVSAPSVIPVGWSIANDTTEISAHAFEGVTFAEDASTIIVIPASVTKIGEGAFMNCALTGVTFDSKTSITEIPAYCFYGSKLEKFVLPDTATKIGDYAYANTEISSVILNKPNLNVGSSAFANNSELNRVEVTLNSLGASAFSSCTALSLAVVDVNEMGRYVFFGCRDLEEVTFLKTVGAYAFATEMYSRKYDSSLKTVTFGSDVTEIGEYAFYGCDEIESVTLNNVTLLGIGAFGNTTALKTVNGLEKVTIIGDYAFVNAPISAQNATLRLTNALYIGAYSFAQLNESNSIFDKVDVTNAQTIGTRAFYNTKVTTVNLGKDLTKIGGGVFSASRLTAFTVDSENERYFALDGVLYRNVDNAVTGETTYALVEYPASKTAESVENYKTYVVIEGTVTVDPYAFGEIKSGTVEKVVLPYSVKTIGDKAFYASGILQYRFESINAPILLTEYNDNGIDGFYSLINANFEQVLVNYGVKLGVEGSVNSTLKMSYPTNGVGYDNFMYRTFFGQREAFGVVMNDETRALKNAIDAFAYSVDEVKAMNTWTVNADNKAKVIAFSDSVKSAHAMYNNITDETQLAYLNDGVDRIALMTEIEKELKSVKSRFGINVNVTQLKLSSNSTHKNEYVTGERFNLNGLELIVIYDDYSSEIADMSKITLSSNFERELNEYDLYVQVEGYGKKFRVPVTVTAKAQQGGGNGGSSSSGNDDRCDNESVTLALTAMLTLLAGALILKK